MSPLHLYYTRTLASTGGASAPFRGLPPCTPCIDDLEFNKRFQRIVAVLLDRGALDERGAKAELARLLGVSPAAVYQAVYRAQRRCWATEVER